MNLTWREPIIHIFRLTWREPIMMYHCPLGWFVYHIEPNKRMCSSFYGCLVSFPERVFSIWRFRLPFKDFEVEVSNFLRITHSQLHAFAWAFVKVFQHWCKYHIGMLTLVIFQHLQRGTYFGPSKMGARIFFLRHLKKVFHIYVDSGENFKCHYVIGISYLKGYCSLCVLPTDNLALPSPSNSKSSIYGNKFWKGKDSRLHRYIVYYWSH